MIVKGFDSEGEPFNIEAPFMAVKPGDRVVIDGWYHKVVVIDPDGVVHVGRAHLRQLGGKRWKRRYLMCS